MGPADLISYLENAFTSVAAAVTAAMLVIWIQKKSRHTNGVGRFIGVLLILLLPGLFFSFLYLLPIELALGITAGVLIVAALWISRTISKDS